MSSPRERQLVLLRGTRAETWEAARRLLAGAPLLRHIIVSKDPVERAAGALRESETRDVLGRTLDLVVLDAHGGLDPETLGRVYGVIGGGGALMIRLDAPDSAGLTTSHETRKRLAAWPYSIEDVGDRWFRRLVTILETQTITPPEALAPFSPERGFETHSEQAAVVAKLSRALVAGGPYRSVVMAPRGRGKSAALGLALKDVLWAYDVHMPFRRVRVFVARPDELDTNEIKRFMGSVRNSSNIQTDIHWLTPPELARLVVPEDDDFDDIVIVDEAAKVPLPVLKAIVTAHAHAKLVFATTTDGYEGTGQGFVLRFVTWLSAQPQGCEVFQMTAPIRWSSNDIIEPFVYQALLLSATPAKRELFGLTPSRDEAQWRLVLRDELIEDEAILAEIFGLLRHAHYRTTPRDLEAMLDAPNMHLHILSLRGHVAAVCLVADEGRLTLAQCRAATEGRTRLLAHAIPDSLCAHMGMRDAGLLHYVRSVRIASHPELRRLGLASALVEAVHAHHAPDVFGTLFGATAEVVAFRRALGYEVVRVSASRGARTGEPSVLMLRPHTTAGRALVDAARRQFEANWRFQQQWILGHGVTPEDAIVATLNTGVPERDSLPPLSPQALAGQLDTYLHGAQTFEQASRAIATLADEASSALHKLPDDLAALVQSRVLEQTSWEEAARRAGMAHAGVAMRAMRRAVSALATAAGLDLSAGLV